MKIVVVTGNHPKDAIGGSELQAYLIAKELKKLGNDSIFCSVLSNYDLDTEEKDGLRYVSVAGHRNIFRRGLKFYKFLKDIQPDVVYVRCLYSFWWVNLISRFLKIPTLYHFYSITHCQYLTFGQYLKWDKEENWRQYLKRMILHNFYVFNCRLASRIICQTEEQRELIDKKLKRTARVIRNGHPIPSNSFEKSDELFNIIWIGKYWKNPDIFVKLAEEFSEVPNLSFLMVGIFPDELKKRFLQYSCLIPNFKFVGELANGEVNRLLEKCHVLVNTSDYEGFSNTFIQAWMRGVPVVSFRVNPDGVLLKSKVGFHSQTIENLKRDIMNLVRDKTLYKSYSLNSIHYAHRKHNLRKTAGQVLDLMGEVERHHE
jgi:glycosyltransferase involved in cell wall biosynthesis